MRFEKMKFGIGRKQMRFLVFNSLSNEYNFIFLVIEQKIQVLGVVYGVVARGCLGILCDLTSLWVP